MHARGWVRRVQGCAWNGITIIIIWKKSWEFVRVWEHCNTAGIYIYTNTHTHTHTHTPGAAVASVLYTHYVYYTGRGPRPRSHSTRVYTFFFFFWGASEKLHVVSGGAGDGFLLPLLVIGVNSTGDHHSHHHRRRHTVHTRIYPSLFRPFTLRQTEEGILLLHYYNNSNNDDVDRGKSVFFYYYYSGLHTWYIIVFSLRRLSGSQSSD
jgi:hypothetical protein